MPTKKSLSNGKALIQKYIGNPQLKQLHGQFCAKTMNNVDYKCAALRVGPSQTFEKCKKFWLGIIYVCMARSQLSSELYMMKKNVYMHIVKKNTSTAFQNAPAVHNFFFCSVLKIRTTNSKQAGPQCKF